MHSRFMWISWNGDGIHAYSLPSVLCSERILQYILHLPWNSYFFFSFLDRNENNSFPGRIPIASFYAFVMTTDRDWWVKLYGYRLKPLSIWMKRKSTCADVHEGVHVVQSAKFAVGVLGATLETGYCISSTCASTKGVLGFISKLILPFSVWFWLRLLTWDACVYALCDLNFPVTAKMMWIPRNDLPVSGIKTEIFDKRQCRSRITLIKMKHLNHLSRAGDSSASLSSAGSSKRTFIRLWKLKPTKPIRTAISWQPWRMSDVRIHSFEFQYVWLCVETNAMRDFCLKRTCAQFCALDQRIIVNTKLKSNPMNAMRYAWSD